MRTFAIAREKEKPKKAETKYWQPGSSLQGDIILIKKKEAVSRRGKASVLFSLSDIRAGDS